ncbi:hypothetical protein NLJ89_g9526 [Agrocybe chaxingu]|uniref:Nephrocystin 3-like N-terminal domain-containing protein n=1 Tax=Agrocybe chaxingu TaxID=84603 RepID=A0A9W8JSI9_9AGAR|nr:hypothetical protein NLJ89_g9526 [Agrocybe chaxingu]
MFNSSQNVQIHDSNLSVTTYNQTVQLGVSKARKGFDILQSMVCPSAFHNSDDRPDPPKCHENTRVAIIAKLVDWVEGRIDTDALVFWLFGPAGAGKSAIARTLAELCEARGLLLASFFFFRSDPGRNTTKSLIASIAYCIALTIPPSRALIESAVETNPLIFQYSLDLQFMKLVIEPLRQLMDSNVFSQIPFPVLIIIDGLDECLAPRQQSNILATLTRCAYRSGLPFKLLVASRPEQGINFSFEKVRPRSMITSLELDNDYYTREDIKTFLHDKFYEITQSHPFRSLLPPSWPSWSQLQALVDKSSGQFIYISLVIRYLDSPFHLPSDRLGAVLQLRPLEKDLPFTELDVLYTHILSGVADLPTVLQILGMKFALQFYPGPDTGCGDIEMVETIMGLRAGDVSILLSGLSSLLKCQDAYIVIHHSSFLDFLQNERRSRRFYIDIREVHTKIARCVLQSLQLPEFERRPYRVMFWIGMAWQLKNAYITTELEDDLWSFDPIQYTSSPEFSSWNYGDILCQFRRDFLVPLENQEAPHLYLHYQEMLSTMVESWTRQIFHSPSKFYLLTACFFVMRKGSRSEIGLTEFATRHFIGFTIFTSRGLTWPLFCSMVFGLDSDDEVHKTFDIDESRTGAALELMPLSSHLRLVYGTPETTESMLPDHMNAEQITRVALACLRYLHRNPPKTRRRQFDFLHVWARRSAHSPWITKRRTQALLGFGAMRQQYGLRLVHQCWKPRVMEADHVSDTTPAQKWRVRHRAWYKNAHRIYAETHQAAQWSFTLLCRALTLATESEELAAALSKPLAPYELFFPRFTTHFKNAREVYLRKIVSTPRPEDILGELIMEELQVSESSVEDAFSPSSESSDEGYTTCPD